MVTVVSPRVCDICLNFYRKENFAGAQPQLGTGGSCSGLLVGGGGGGSCDNRSVKQPPAAQPAAGEPGGHPRTLQRPPGPGSPYSLQGVLPLMEPAGDRPAEGCSAEMGGRQMPASFGGRAVCCRSLLVLGCLLVFAAPRVFCS